MNIPDAYIIAALVGLLAGLAFGYYSGVNIGRAEGWERRRWWQVRLDQTKRDPRTGRFRRVRQ